MGYCYFGRCECSLLMENGSCANDTIDKCIHPAAVEDYKSAYELPSAQRWIPMSERLPEKDGRYLCSYGKHIHITQMINHHFRHYGEIADHLISAWMPLPEPYKEDEHD